MESAMVKRRPQARGVLPPKLTPAPLAHAARPFEILSVATGSTAIGREKASTLRYQDSHLIDRMHARGQLVDRLHEAALKVLELHEDSGLQPSVSAGYAPKGWSRGHDDETDELAALTGFRHLLGGVSPAHAWLLHAMCLGQHPGVRFLGSLQAVLDDLARRWKIDA